MPNKNVKIKSSAYLGFETKLWATADKLRGHMDPSEYKHVVLGLIFLKYISDSFERRYQEVVEVEKGDPENRDYYISENVFWVPQEARWEKIQAEAKQPNIGKVIDNAMIAIEKDNPVLKGVLPKNYNDPDLNKQKLGGLIDLISSIGLQEKDNHSRDILGRVYEYFLGKFASKEGKAGGDYYTPRCIVKLLVEMIEPYNGRVFDPCCGSGGMFVQSEAFIREHGGTIGDLSVYGQESNPTTWRLAKMNLAIRHIDADLGGYAADSFLNDLHKDLKSDFILANPPFNLKDWGGENLQDDVRWKKYGMPPVNNANYAWIQHFISHLKPSGIAGFVLANGSMSSNTSNEGEIRKNIIEDQIVDCMIALPGQLFYGTAIPACLWFIARNRQNGKYRDRRNETLFIDARKMGVLIDRVHRELTDEEINKIAGIYHAWRGEKDAGEYSDIAGFCKSATKDEIKANGYVLTPGRYVGTEETEDDGELFEEKMTDLTKQLYNQFTESEQLTEQIKSNLNKLGFNNLGKGEHYED